MNEQLRKYLESLGLRKDATAKDAWQYYAGLEGDQKTRAAALKLGQDPDAPATPDAPAQQHTPAEPDTNTRSAAELELERRDAIEDLSMRFDAEDTLKREAITKRWSVDQFKDKLLEHQRSRPAPAQQAAPAGFTRDNVGDVSMLAAGLAIRTGGDPIRVADATIDRSVVGDERKRQAERIANEASRFANVSLVDLCRASLAAENQPVPFDRNETMRAAVSTGALGRVMEPALNARLMQAYMEGPDTTSTFTVETDVPDFRTNERHAIGKTAMPKKRHRGQNAEHSTIEDRPPEEYKVFEYADQLRIDRQDIIDDRLDVFQRWPMERGFAFRRLKPQLVYYILLANDDMADGTALFHSDHNNAVDTAFSSSALQDAVTALRKQQLNNVSLAIEPRTLIVNSDLEFDARQLLRSSTLITGEDATQGSRNVVADLNLTLAISPELANGVTDPDSGSTASGSSTAWYLAADPRLAPVIEVGYVAGLGRMPQTNTFAKQGEDGFWGIEYAAAHAVAAKALDHLGLQRGNS